MTTTTSEGAPRAAATGRTRFYVWSAVAMAVAAFVGFAPTFWAPLAQGIPERIGVIAIHGAVFYAWCLFLIYQAWLVQSGNTARHRETGLIGVSLATAMVIFGTLTAINSAQRAAAAGFAEPGQTFMVVPMAALLVFGALVIAALVNVRRPEWHKRFLLAATAVTLEAPIARPYIAYILMGGHLPPFQGNVGLAGLGGPPPPVIAVLAPALIADLFIVAGMVFDWRTLGKVHPAYWWAGGFTVAVQVLRDAFSTTPLWHAIAQGLIALAG